MFKKQISRKIILISVFSSLVLSKNSFQNKITENNNSNLTNNHVKKHFLLNNNYDKSPQYMFYKINKTLKVNDCSIEVSNLQRLLQWLGYFDGKIDGYYDSKTKNAIKNLKESLNLKNGNNVSNKDWISFVNFWYSKEEEILKLCPPNIPYEYKPYVSALIKKHPNWVFETYNIDDTWDNFIFEQTQNNRSMISSSNPKNWIDSKGYRSQWSFASKDIIYYFADPRNFLNEVNIFQFEKLSFSENTHTLEGINQVLKDTFMDNEKSDYNYAIDYLDAGKKYNISPYFLASKTKLELGVNGNQLTKGTVHNYFGYFNYYNIGSYESSSNYKVLVNGAIKAKKNDWTTKRKAILGGAKYISESYIKKGQDTKYSQKYDFVNEKYTHQYVQNLESPINESKYYYKAYNEMSMLENTFIFKLPIFDDFSQTPKSLPLNSLNFRNNELIKKAPSTVSKTTNLSVEPTPTPTITSTPDKTISKTTLNNNSDVKNNIDYSNIIDIKYHSNKYNIVSMLSKNNISLISNRFFPDNYIKKSEALVIISKSLKLNPISDFKLKFKDLSEIPKWSLNYFKYAVENNIINGNGKNELQPLKNTTNEEFIKLLVTSMGYGKSSKSYILYSDKNKISNWSKGYINKAIELNILPSKGMFNPKKYITRSEICSICNKLPTQ